MSHQAVADEIYMQFAKQLTRTPAGTKKPGPSREAATLGWETLAICFRAFGPSDKFRPYLECWIREQPLSEARNKDILLQFLHQTKLQGNMMELPTVDSVERSLSRIRQTAKASSKQWRLSGRHQNWDFSDALEDVALAPEVVPWKTKMSRKKLIDISGFQKYSRRVSLKVAKTAERSAKRRTKKSKRRQQEEEEDEEEEEEEEEEESDEDSGGASKSDLPPHWDTYVAEYDYDAAEDADDELSIAIGDVLFVDTALEDNQQDNGWFIAQDKDGNSGLVPENYLKLQPKPKPKPKKKKKKAPKKKKGKAPKKKSVRPPPPPESESEPEPEPQTPDGTKYKAVYDFDAESPDELTFKAGEFIMCTEIPDPEFNGWFLGTNSRGEGGLVPTSYLELA